MNQKYYVKNSILVLIITLLLTFHYQKTYSLEESSIVEPTIKLEYTTNQKLLETRILKFIDTIDDTLIPLYEYQEDINLNDNYQFLTNFALSFISNHLVNYQEDIITGIPYQYTDDSGNKYTTNKYIPLDLIYEITYSIFQRRYYHISSSSFQLIDNQLPLIADSHSIEMHLEKITKITINENQLFATVKYQEVDIYYQYEFEMTDNHLTIKNLNIEV